MATQKHLRHAPIVEAIVEFHVDGPHDASLGAGEKLYERIKGAYPIREKQVTGTFRLQLTAPDSIKAEAGKALHSGFRFKSADGNRVLNAGLSAFSFHRLKPYTRWEDLRDDARTLWQTYCEEFHPKAITRIGVRYVNNVSIPMTATNLSSYLVPGPIIPEGLPQSVQSFFSRVEIIDQSNERVGIISQVSQGATGVGMFSVVLDLDVVKTGAFVASDDAIWIVVDKMRDFKNQLFFKSVTDLLLEQYE